MKKLNVLVVCEESQEVCKAFREKGHNAYSCDTQKCSGGRPEWHIWGDCRPLLNGCCDFVTMDGVKHFIYYPWDMIIGFPPCTYLSKVSAPRLMLNGVVDPIRYDKLLKAREFFYEILNANCEKIAIENPTPLKIAGLPQPDCVIQPYEFGHPYKKRTCLWLKNLPPLLPVFVIDKNECTPWVCARSRNGKSIGKAYTKKQRSKTFRNIALAMANQWGGGIDFYENCIY